MYCKNMKLMRSASEQNTYFTYVCLINDIKPSLLSSEAHKRLSLHLPDVENDEVCEEEDHIRIERSKALHELVESHRKNEDEALPQKYNDIVIPSGTPSGTPYATTSGEDFNNISEVDDGERDGFSENPNPNILKLTKMKWLTEEKENVPDSSSPSLSPASSSTSTQCSNESETNLTHNLSFNDKYLSTIIRLDKEHNMFGLSNIAIVGSRASKRIKKDDDKAVFHQTAIVQICCEAACCKHKSKTDMPASLKSGRCRGCSHDSCCSISVTPSVCASQCYEPPCLASCTSCRKSSCKIPCAASPSNCFMDCSNCYGMRLVVKRKAKPQPIPTIMTPMSSCVLDKPYAARSCHHVPQCMPPSSCFPYLMPCFWPARPDAPCATPDQCFHIPPCKPARIHRPVGTCPLGGCLKHLCTNKACFELRRNVKKPHPGSVVPKYGATSNLNLKVKGALSSESNTLKAKGSTSAESNALKAKGSPSAESNALHPKDPSSPESYAVNHLSESKTKHVPSPSESSTHNIKSKGSTPTGTSDANLKVKGSPPIGSSEHMQAKGPPGVSEHNIKPKGPPGISDYNLKIKGPPGMSDYNLKLKGVPGTLDHNIKPKGQSGTSVHNIKQKGLSGTSVQNIKPQGPPGISRHDMKPQGPPGTSVHNIRPQGPPGISGHNIKPQGPPGITGPNIRPQGPPGTSVHNINPQGPPGITGPNIRPQGPPGTSVHNINPQGPPGITGPNIKPQGPPGISGHNIKPQGPPGTSDHNMRPRRPSKISDQNLKPIGPPGPSDPNMRPRRPSKISDQNLKPNGPPGTFDPNIKPKGPPSTTNVDPNIRPKGPPPPDGSNPNSPPSRGPMKQ